jgi:hypothetical protein
LHPRTNEDRLYLSRNEGGRGLLNVEDTVNMAKIGLSKYIDNSEERLLRAARQTIAKHGG